MVMMMVATALKQRQRSAHKRQCNYCFHDSMSGLICFTIRHELRLIYLPTIPRLTPLCQALYYNQTEHVHTAHGTT